MLCQAGVWCSSPLEAIHCSKIQTNPAPFKTAFCPAVFLSGCPAASKHRTKQGEKKKTHTSKISSGGRKQTNQVIKTIAPLAPLCSWAQESLIGAVSAHRQVVLQSISCSKEHADSIRRPRAPPPRTDTAGRVREGCLGASVGRVPPPTGAPKQ